MSSTLRRTILHGTRSLALAFTLLAFAGVGQLGCGESSTANTSATLKNAQLCDPAFPQDCPFSTCADVVGGNSVKGGVAYQWDMPAVKGTICTRSCSQDGDCAGFNFASANGHQTASEEWRCVSNVCRVRVTAPPSAPVDPCAGCGGVFCSGNCIGCSQC